MKAYEKFDKGGDGGQTEFVIGKAIRLMVISAGGFLILATILGNQKVLAPELQNKPSATPEIQKINGHKVTSAARIYTTKDDFVPIYLYSENSQTREIGEDISCMAPKKGLRETAGRFKLVAQEPKGNTEIDLGEMTFVSQTPWDGELLTFDLGNKGFSNLLVLKNYGSCNWTYYLFFGLKGDNKLVQYQFQSSDGSLADRLLISELLWEKDALKTKTYSQGSGNFVYTIWQFDDKKGLFKPTNTWEEKE